MSDQPLREAAYAAPGYRRAWHALLDAQNEANYELRVALIEGAMVELVESTCGVVLERVTTTIEAVPTHHPSDCFVPMTASEYRVTVLAAVRGLGDTP